MEAPVVWVNAPVRDEEDSISAALGFGMRADHQFTRILSVARMGETGETYAFDEAGFLISESRFDEQLRSMGMISEEPDSRSIFTIQLRDLGGDFNSIGDLPKDLENRPLTKLVTTAIAARSFSDPAQRKGVILDPYGGYRGSEVIGAWIWLDNYEFGVATEVAHSEAFALLRYPMTAFWIRFGFLAAAVIGLLVATCYIALLERKLGVIQQLGQYSLVKKIGQGGMGEVYLAKHAMLRRPTAVKILKEHRPSATASRRFEREVQAASQLTDPHTIEIYDYGRTSDGTLYYAMEYLSGISLAELIAIGGPQPPARVVKILQQICYSLREAHGLGLIHRDIKPQNIMLCNRGDDPDYVKVLDFGLVKDLTGLTAGNISSTSILPGGAVAGTPLYMAPETLQDPLNVDHRADLYSLGAVGYFALTGQPVFQCQSEMDLLYHVVNVVPDRPTARLETPIPNELDQLIVDCLSKEPQQRPDTIEVVLEILENVAATESWTSEQARDWWAQYAVRISAESSLAPQQDTSIQAKQPTRTSTDTI